MQTEKEKMLSGQPYKSSDPELVAGRLYARELCQKLNSLPPSLPQQEYRALYAELFGAPTDIYITPPFFCDYGRNIRFGENVYFNFNCVILDVSMVTIGSNVLFGPGVHIYTATHPLNVEARRSGIEFGKPVVIGDDVWIGGSSVVCPGVTIGNGAVIGAGSVVASDVPANVLAAGNPCRVIRQL